ncbi:MAG TPA: cold shock domain-containing protein [Candidatus Binatia bacterium]|nr:cold shock domain-containing protein [Candidatus Binatia bacterium]
MSTQLQKGQRFPDLTLPDHHGQIVRFSQLTAPDEFSRRLGFTEGRPLIVVFYRGFFCPRDRLQLSQLTAFYPEVVLNYASLVAISVDPPIVAAAYRAGLGAPFPFLSDQDRVAISQLGIVDNTDGEYPNVAIPHTFCLAPDLTIDKIYNGWWFVGRPTLEELRQDLRALMEGRTDYPHAAWDTSAVKSVRIPAAYWTGETEAAWNVVGRGKGRVRWFTHGYGFIETEEGEEIFVHFTGIPGQGERSLTPGAAVEFDIVEGPGGRHAVRVRLIDP